MFSDNGLHTASIRSAASKLHSREGAFLQTFLVVTINLTVLLRRWSFIGACSSGLWWHSPPRQTHFILTQSGMRAGVHRAGRPHHDLGLNLHLCEFIRLTCDSNELQVWIHQVMKTLQSFVEFSRFKASWILKILWNVEAGNHQFVCTFYRLIRRRYLFTQTCILYYFTIECFCVVILFVFPVWNILNDCAWISELTVVMWSLFLITCSSVDHAHQVYGEQNDKDTRAEDIKLIYTITKPSD